MAFVRGVLPPQGSYPDLGAKRGHSTLLLVSGPGAMAEMLFLFSFLSGAKSLASHSQPWPAGHKDTALLGRLAQTPAECAQELGEGKGEDGKERPGGVWEAVGGLGPPLARAPAGLPGGRAKAGLHTHPAFCGSATQRRGKDTSSVLTEEADNPRKPGPARNSHSRAISLCE